MDDLPIVSRRHFLEHAGYPTLVAVVALILNGGFTIWWAGRSKDRHDLSAAIVKSGNANLQDTYPPGDPFAFLVGAYPIPGTPDPNGLYTYTVYVRNNGDFPEKNIRLAINFRSDTSQSVQFDSLSFDTSSELLAKTVTGDLSDTQNLVFSIPQLNPGEWLSWVTNWALPLRVTVQLRSDDISTNTSS